MDNDEALTVAQETEILGKKIKMYGTIEFPYFVASDVAEWLGERDGYTVAKELRIGRNTLFAYLRGKDIMFYQDNSNVPYQRFMNQGLFRVIESPCTDGKCRPTTYSTKKGLEYIRKLLRKDGYYNTEVA